MRHSSPFLLSERASERATASTCANKVVGIEGKTHVVWTDSVASTHGRSYDHARREWGPPVEIGVGVDNHNNPALTADRLGRLRVAYGPHGSGQSYLDKKWPPGEFKHAVAAAPHTLNGLDRPGPSFGYRGTYASLIHTPSDLDCIVYRGGEAPQSLLFQKQIKHSGNLSGWSHAQALMSQDIPPGYTFYNAQIACDMKGNLYVGGMFYSEHLKGSAGVAVLQSTDLGETWTDLLGEPTGVPIRCSERFAVPHPRRNTTPYLGGLAIDSQGRLWVLTYSRFVDRRTWISCWDGSSWQTKDLARFLPSDRVASAGTLSVDTRNRIHAALEAAEARLVTPDGAIWCHPSSEIFHLVSSDEGRTFDCHQVSESDPQVANWLPNISKPGPFHPVENPIILYTHGGNRVTDGEGCHTTSHNEAYCVIVE